jgi:hypothetical protein
MQDFMVNHRRSTSVVAYVGWRLKQRREDPAMSHGAHGQLIGLVVSTSPKTIGLAKAASVPVVCSNYVVF